MTNISRRSVAKGAAWSVPAVAIAGSAPALAASIYQIPCPATAPLRVTGAKFADTAIGTQTSYDTTSGHASLGKGTFYSWNAGMWQFTAPDPEVTGYKLTFPGTVGITTASGVPSQATFTGGLTTPQVIGAGLTMNFSVQSGVPYQGLTKKAWNYANGFSIPFCVTYLVGLSTTVSPACCFYINFDTTAGPDTFGNYPNSNYVTGSGANYTVTTTPKYGV